MTDRSLKVAELCALLKVAVPSGVDAATVITGITTLEEATPSQVSFLARVKMADVAEKSRAALVIVPQGTQLQRAGAVEVPEVWMSVLAVLGHFHPAPAPKAFVHPTAVVPDSVRLGADVFIGPNVTLGEGVTIGDRTRIGAQCHLDDGVVVGEDCLFHPRVTVMHGCRVGRRAILHPGVVIGSDGFKYEVAGGRLRKLPQVGIVVIEDDVEIGANAAIDRASFTETRIGARAKLDNLVHIAHNVSVGSDTLLAAQVGIAGSTRIGRGVQLGGQVGVRDNIAIADGCRIAAQSGVVKGLPPGTEVIGSPPMDLETFARIQVILRKLPDLYRKLQPLLRPADPNG